MSAILQPEKKISTSHNFSKVPEVRAWGVGQLIPDARSGGAPSSNLSDSTGSTTARNVDRQEPCFITKSSCFTHERAHWVNAVRKKPEVKAEVEKLLEDRRIVFPGFRLNNTSNLSNLDRGLYAALDKYAFFAVTGSLNTLTQLITMLKADNDDRQEKFDLTGYDRQRVLNLEHPAITNPQYELVALRPQHMLPDGKVLVAYSRDPSGVVSHKIYVPADQDNTLREFPGTQTCPRFPSFSFSYPRPELGRLNPFLVILNAEIKFRRYLRQRYPAPLNLPADVMTLINLTLELVEKIYWDPIIRPNTRAARIRANLTNLTPRPAPELRIPSPPSDTGVSHAGHVNEDEIPIVRPHRGGVRRPAASATLEERREYGQYLLSGRDLPDSDDEDLLDTDNSHHHTENHLAYLVEEVHAWRKAVNV